MEQYHRRCSVEYIYDDEYLRLPVHELCTNGVYNTYQSQLITSTLNNNDCVSTSNFDEEQLFVVMKKTVRNTYQTKILFA